MWTACVLREDQVDSDMDLLHVEINLFMVCSGLTYIVFFELHSTTQMLTLCTHTHPYEHMYANPNHMAPLKD
jgi:hypothetical protein